MKKKILKNATILTFALFGLGIISVNVTASHTTLKENDGGGGGNGKTLVERIPGHPDGSHYFCCIDGSGSCGAADCP